MIETCNKIFVIDPLHYKTHFVIANAYMLAEKYDEANVHIEKGLKYYPNDLFGLFQAGTINIKHLKAFLETENPDKNKIKQLEDKTIYWFDKAFEIRSDFSNALNNLGFLYERQAFRLTKEGNRKDAEIALKKAETTFDRAIKLDPEYLDALLNKANILAQTNRGKEAIPLALKALNLTANKFKQKDDAVRKLIEENFQKSTGTFNDAVTQRIAASQNYLSAAPRAIIFLRNEYSKNRDFKSLLETFDFEMKLLNHQIETKKEVLVSTLKELESAKKDNSNIRKGMTIEQLEDFATSQKKTFEQVEKNYQLKKANLLIDIADASFSLGKSEDYITILQQVVEFATQNQCNPEQESYARYKIIAFYMSLNNKDRFSKFSIIEENFKKATYRGNIELNNALEKLEQQFKEIKRTTKPE